MTLINDSCRRWPSSKWGTLMARQHRQGIYTAQSIINEWTSATERINYPSARCVSTRQTNLCFTDTAFHSLLFHWLAKSSACNMLAGWVEILAAWTVADNENVRVRWQAIGFTRRSSSIKGESNFIEQLMYQVEIKLFWSIRSKTEAKRWDDARCAAKTVAMATAGWCGLKDRIPDMRCRDFHPRA